MQLGPEPNLHLKERPWAVRVSLHILTAQAWDFLIRKSSAQGFPNVSDMRPLHGWMDVHKTLQMDPSLAAPPHDLNALPPEVNLQGSGWSLEFIENT